MPVKIRINGRDLGLHKATTDPVLGARNVLTSSPWEYVTLWLKRARKDAALFYWQQAQTFSLAATALPVTSAPLLLYYGYMNATKALLSAKKIPFDEHHGIRAHNMRRNSRKIALSNEGVRLMTRGIAPALSQCLGETEPTTTHSLEDLLFNLPCIHRTFCITYRNQQDLFIPLTDCGLVYEPASGAAYFAGKLSQDVAGWKVLRRLPSCLVADLTTNDGRSIRSRDSVELKSPNPRNVTDIASLASLLRSLRLDVNYIAGAQTLWYAKAVVRGPARLKRSPLTCTLMAMHRLSELCRYRPIELASFLGGQKNWLLTEFIRMSPPQFIDELSAELTGQQFMIPNVRPAN
jgi:hypothetical protein